MDERADLAREVREGAVLESVGTFTVALEKAREKLKRFQLPDPRYYILQLVQAVVASGAHSISVATAGLGSATETTPAGSSDLGEVFLGYRLTLTFNGPGYEKDELKDLYDYIFESQNDRNRDRLRELALGTLSCQGLDTWYIRIHSGGAEWAWRQHEKETVRMAPAELLHVIEVRGGGQCQEVDLLRECCQAVPIPIRVNGELINPGFTLRGACPWPAWTFQRANMQGAIGLPYSGLAQTRLVINRYGVRITRKNEPRIYPPVVIVLENPDLRKNVSQSDIVEDEAYQSCLSELQFAVMEFAYALCRMSIPGYQREGVVAFQRALITEWIPTQALQARPEDVATELQPLMRMPLFTDIHKTRRSLADIAPHFARDGYVCIANRDAPTGDWMVLQPSAEERDALQSLFEKVKDVDGVLKSWRASGDNARPGPEAEPIAEPVLSHEVTRGPKTLTFDQNHLPVTVLSWREISQGSRSMTITVEDAYPMPTTRFSLLNPPGVVVRRELCGLSLHVMVRGAGNPETLLQLSAATAMEEAPGIYATLLRMLLDDFPGFSHNNQRRAQHVREHLLRWWLHLLDGAAPVGAERARERLGDVVWTAPVFDTRHVERVSLADMAFWVGGGRVLATAFGGGRIKEDYALEASPAVMALLSHIFGKAAVRRVTLEQTLVAERLEQRQLPGAAARGFLVPPPAPSHTTAPEPATSAPAEPPAPPPTTAPAPAASAPAEPPPAPTPTTAPEPAAAAPAEPPPAPPPTTAP
ncbi:MAG: hypothetical protein ACYCW6_19570, partial [Candidatus Xenobia bacterium]